MIFQKLTIKDIQIHCNCSKTTAFRILTDLKKSFPNAKRLTFYHLADYHGVPFNDFFDLKIPEFIQKSPMSN